MSYIELASLVVLFVVVAVVAAAAAEFDGAVVSSM